MLKQDVKMAEIIASVDRPDYLENSVLAKHATSYSDHSAHVRNEVTSLKQYMAKAQMSPVDKAKWTRVIRDFEQEITLCDNVRSRITFLKDHIS